MKTILQIIAHWTPVAICAFISLIALYADSPAGKLAFFRLLPFCFFCVAVVTTSMNWEMRVLRKRLADLEQKKSS